MLSSYDLSSVARGSAVREARREGRTLWRAEAVEATRIILPVGIAEVG
jgi:hypothetical protein